MEPKQSSKANENVFILDLPPEVVACGPLFNIKCLAEASPLPHYSCRDGFCDFAHEYRGQQTLNLRAPS